MRGARPCPRTTRAAARERRGWCVRERAGRGDGKHRPACGHWMRARTRPRQRARRSPVSLSPAGRRTRTRPSRRERGTASWWGVGYGRGTEGKRGSERCTAPTQPPPPPPPLSISVRVTAPPRWAHAHCAAVGAHKGRRRRVVRSRASQPEARLCPPPTIHPKAPPTDAPLSLTLRQGRTGKGGRGGRGGFEEESVIETQPACMTCAFAPPTIHPKA